MYRYAQHAKARADELLELIDPEQRDLLRVWIETPGNVDLSVIPHDPSARTLKILSQTPAKDRAWVAKKDRSLFLREWLVARYWALRAANTLQLAAGCEDLVGFRYREAIPQAALAARQDEGLPTLEDILDFEWDAL